MQNGSSTLATWMQRFTSVKELRCAYLPVAWDLVPQILSELIERWKPRAWLGLGEGQAGRVALESRAYNLQSGTDEASQVRSEELIDPNAPSWAEGNWPQPDNKTCSLLPATLPFVESQDAGRFLCNRVLWQAARSDVPCVGFLHVPPQGEMTNRQYLRLLGPFLKQFLSTTAKVNWRN
jgi:pyrrolidone-carboxylate peptidase